MSGLRPNAPTDYYWVWSPAGPSFTGVFHECHFKEGMHPFPMMAPVARKLERYGYMLTPYEEGASLLKWVGEHNRHEAVFQVPKKRKPGRPRKKK